MTREDILTAAREIVAEEGYDRLTTGNLAERLGVKKPSLYHHFPSLSAIIHAMYEDYGRKLSRLGFTIDFSASAEKIISTTISHYREIYSDEVLSDYFSLITQRRDIDEEAYELYESLHLMIEAQTSAVIENLLERGKLHFPDGKLLSGLFASSLITRLEGEGQREDDGRFTEGFCAAFR